MCTAMGIRPVIRWCDTARRGGAEEWRSGGGEEGRRGEIVSSGPGAQEMQGIGIRVCFGGRTRRSLVGKSDRWFAATNHSVCYRCWPGYGVQTNQLRSFTVILGLAAKPASYASSCTRLGLSDHQQGAYNCSSQSHTSSYSHAPLLEYVAINKCAQTIPWEPTIIYILPHILPRYQAPQKNADISVVTPNGAICVQRE